MGPVTPTTVLPEALRARFAVVRHLGTGSCGEVCEVRELATATHYALKLVRLEADVERTRRELETSLRIQHGGVLRCFEVGVHGATAYLLLELAEESLEAVMADPGRRAQAWDLLRQALQGLAALHAAGVVHRDLKPANLLVVRGEARIGDLGLARSLELGTLTAAGLVLGTPAYMAPEQARGERAAAASDVFAMGVMFYELVEGRLPYAGAEHLGLGELLARVARAELVGMNRGRRILAATARAQLESMLHPDPARRPHDLVALHAALGDAATALVPPEPADRQAATVRLEAPPAERLTAEAPGGAPASAAGRPAAPPGGAGTRPRVAALALGLGLLTWLVLGRSSPATMLWSSRHRLPDGRVLVALRTSPGARLAIPPGGEGLSSPTGDAHLLLAPTPDELVEVRTRAGQVLMAAAVDPRSCPPLEAPTVRYPEEGGLELLFPHREVGAPRLRTPAGPQAGEDTPSGLRFRVRPPGPGEPPLARALELGGRLLELGALGPLLSDQEATARLLDQVDPLDAPERIRAALAAPSPAAFLLRHLEASGLAARVRALVPRLPALLDGARSSHAGRLPAALSKLLLLEGLMLKSGGDPEALGLRSSALYPRVWRQQTRPRPAEAGPGRLAFNESGNDWFEFQGGSTESKVAASVVIGGIRPPRFSLEVPRPPRGEAWLTLHTENWFGRVYGACEVNGQGPFYLTEDPVRQAPPDENQAALNRDYAVRLPAGLVSGRNQVDCSFHPYRTLVAHPFVVLTGVSLGASPGGD